MHYAFGRFLATSGEWAVFVSSPAVVPRLAKSRSCLYSSRCLRRPPHQPITRVLLLHCHSQLLFKLCLVKLTASTRPDLVRVRVRFGPLFAPSLHP